MAEPGYDFTKETAERIIRAVRKIEALPPDLRRPPGSRGFDELHPVWFRNESPSASDEVPPFGVGAIVGVTDNQGFPLLRVEKPSSVIAPAYLVNGNIAVPTSDHGYGYASGIVTVQYSGAPTTNYETYGPTSGSWALSQASTIPLVKAIGVVNSSNIAGYTSGPTMAAYMLAPSSAADVKLAVSSENTGVYANTLFGVNPTTEFRTAKDAIIDFEVSGTTPNERIYAFWDTDAVPGYVVGVRQFVIKDSSDKLAWTTITEGSAAVDEKLAASSENDGVYWGGLHANFNATTVFDSTADFRIDSEVVGTTPNQDIRLYIDNSTMFNYDAAYHQFCMHNDSSGGLKWSRWTPAITSSGVYNSSNDISVSAELDAGVELRPFIDASGISGYSTAQQQYLGHTASGLITWSTNADAAAASTVVTLTYGAMYSATIVISSTNVLAVTSYSGSASNGMTVNATSGEITVSTSGTYMLTVRGESEFNGSYSGMTAGFSVSHVARLYKNGVNLDDIAFLRIPVSTSASGLENFAVTQVRPFAASDVLQVRYTANAAPNGDANFRVQQVSFTMLKLK